MTQPGIEPGVPRSKSKRTTTAPMTLNVNFFKVLFYEQLINIIRKYEKCYNQLLKV